MDNTKLNSWSSLKLALAAREIRAMGSIPKVDPIAIIGIGCRLPGGIENIDQYWELLKSDGNAVCDVPEDRWSNEKFHDSNPNVQGKTVMHRGGFIESPNAFDARLFRISPKEARRMDPQQKILLETCWSALEDAGLAYTISESQTGVYIGVGNADEAVRQYSGDVSDIDLYSETGTNASIVSGRLAYFLGTEGTAISVDTACSSSLVAIHLACQSLRNGENTLAIAGGVNCILVPQIPIAQSQGNMLSPDGQCKTFDESADGYGRGEGCGIIILKRLSSALADGDQIHGIIRGSATNQDGKSSGLTAPNGTAQRKVYRQALENAGLSPLQVQHIECHGTGTPLGDPIEVNALNDVYGQERCSDDPLYLGSIKANIGHLETGAGVAGVIKAVLCLKYKKIPANIHVKKLNSTIEWARMPIEVPTEMVSWACTADRRFCGVSAFGFSGTNVHMILEEVPEIPKASKGGPDRPVQVLTISAQTNEALKGLARRYVEFLGEPSSGIEDICYTANSGRYHFPKRFSVLGASSGEMRTALQRKLDNGKQSYHLIDSSGSVSPLAFLFTGQGAQYPGMTKELYDTCPSFHKTMNDCSDGLEPIIGYSLIDRLYGKASNDDEAVRQTIFVQPALYAIQCSLVTLWRSWGIEPDCVLGHSVGQVAASFAAGVFSMEDGMRLIGERARLMQELTIPGKMLAVWASEDATRPFLSEEDGVSIAALNAPELTVISGESKIIEEIRVQLEGSGIKNTFLDVSHAFHSPLMEPVLQPFGETIQSINFKKPNVNIVADSTGRLDEDSIASPEYWIAHICQPIRFFEGLQTLYQEGCRNFLEIGPHTTLSGLGRQMDFCEAVDWLPSLKKSTSDWNQLLESLSCLYEKGAEIDWIGFEEPYKKSRRTVSLPIYPFQRQEYRMEVRKAATPSSGFIHPLLGRRISLAGEVKEFYENQISVENPAFMSDHVLYDKIIVPGTTYMEMMAAILKEKQQNFPVSIQEIFYENPIFLNEGSEKTIQCVYQKLDESVAKISIHCLDENDTSVPEWIEVAYGKSTTSTNSIKENYFDLECLKASCSNEESGQDFYSRIAEYGLGFREKFQGIQRIWWGREISIGEIQLHVDLLEGCECYTAHPALFDACLQVAISFFPPPRFRNDAVYVAAAMENIIVYGDVPSSVVAIAEPISNDGEGLLSFKITITDSSGKVIAIIGEHVTRKYSPSHSLDGAVPLFDVTWNEISRDILTKGESRFIRENESMLVLARNMNRLEEIALVLQGWGGEIIKQTFSEALPLARLQECEKLCVVFYCAPGEEVNEVVRDTELLCAEVLQVLHLLVSNDLGQSILFLTQRAEPIDCYLRPDALAQHAVLSMARTLAYEHPELVVGMIDISNGPGKSEGKRLAALLADPRSIKGKEIAIRGDKSFLRQFFFRPESDRRGLQRLSMARGRGIDGLHLEELPGRKPRSGEVEVEIRASGVNFRDLLNALEMYPGEVGLPGGECSGVIVSIPEGEEDRFKVGDWVIVSEWGSFANRICVRKELVVPLPDCLTFADGASIPAVFLTAYYALVIKAGIRPGQKVLIHAAAGGVGLAAIQMAKLYGAEIFATASEAKWHYLKSIGVSNIMDSRLPGFAEKIKELTQGGGVDIILNSLSGKFIDESVSILNPEGIFLELGKRGILSPAEFENRCPGGVYHIIDLFPMVKDEASFIGKMLCEIVDMFKEGKLTVLPRNVFPLAQAEEAFAFMQKGHHIGKIVMTPTERPLELSATGTHLVTGGLGGLGGKVVEWLAERGVQHIALVSRNKPKAERLLWLDMLREKGINIEHFAANVACERELGDALGKIEDAMPGLTGIFHLAGVLDDGVITQQTPDRLKRVLQPKVAGTWNLHELTKHHALNAFVIFSSIASSIGSPGQINYSAANGFEDAFASYRRSLGFPTVVINWPAWAEVGMAAESKTLGSYEFDVIQPRAALNTLERILEENPLQANVISFDRNNFRPDSPFLENLFSGLIKDGVKVEGEEARAETRNIRESILNSNSDEQGKILLQYLVDTVAQITESEDSSSIDSQLSLISLGVDSLMATQFRNKIVRECEVSIPMSLVMGRFKLKEISDKILEKIVGSE